MHVHLCLKVKQASENKQEFLVWKRGDELVTRTTQNQKADQVPHWLWDGNILAEHLFKIGVNASNIPAEMVLLVR